MVFNIINVAEPQLGNFITKIISWLVDGTTVAIGIILFTLLLKLITLPFDFMSRASMRKNSVKMEEMRPELERLQKQYANDKALYNQKMMALYKKNGYSMWGACLPTILTLVIFIVAINGFTTYSQYKNRDYFYEMAKSYNNVIYAGFECDGEYIKRDSNGKLIIDDEYFYNYLGAEDNKTLTLNDINRDNNPFTVYLTKGESNFYTLKTSNGYMEYTKYYAGKDKDGKDVFNSESFSPILSEIAKGKDSPLASKENHKLLNSKGKALDLTSATSEEEKMEITKSFINGIRAEMSAEMYRETNSSFLWVKNIWVTDSPLAHPVADSAQTLNQSTSCSCNAKGDNYMDSDTYKALTANLNNEKNAPNGYFILVILTAGTSLLLQLITARSQKAQMELQTVDGQGAQTQKMMTWMMPILMAVFAFVYTAAFSIYIILSSIISVLTTFGINAYVDRKYKSKATANAAPIRGRVYVPKEEDKPVEKKDKKKKEEEKGDFLNSDKENKRIKRFRVKK